MLLSTTLAPRQRRKKPPIFAGQRGAQVEVVQDSVADPDGCRTLAETAGRRGQLDILVNNARIIRHATDHGDLDALSKADSMDTHEVNVVGPYLMLQATKGLLESAYQSTDPASAVLNTPSIAGVKSIGSSVAYAASKRALNTMTVSLARALAPAIRVNAICPGFIGTRWFKDTVDEEAYENRLRKIEAITPLGVASSPDDIADTALFF